MLFNVSQYDYSESSSVFKDYLGMKIWEQRHLAVSKFIEEKKITKIMDIACSDGKLIQRISRSSTLEYIAGIDIDDQTLKDTVHNAHPQPIQNDIKYRREKPLIVEIYKGDATFPYIELKQKNVQLITMIQFIQHLKIEKLPCLNQTIFDFLRPQYVMITTPNKQFNMFFNLKDNQMRHWDHKYQWSRSQFKDYCQDVSLKYSYSYKIFGVGQHKQDGSKGFCSQGVIFTRNQQTKDACIKLSLSKEAKILQLNPQIQLIKLKKYEFPFWKQYLDIDIKCYLSRTFRKKISQDPFQCFIQWKYILQKFAQSNIGECLMKSGFKIDKELIKPYVTMLQQYDCVVKREGIQVVQKMIAEQQQEDHNLIYDQSQYITESMSKIHGQGFIQY